VFRVNVRAAVALVAGAWAGAVTAYILSDALALALEPWVLASGAVVGALLGLATYSLIKRGSEEDIDYYPWEAYGYTAEELEEARGGSAGEGYVGEAGRLGAGEAETYLDEFDDETMLKVWALTKSILERLTRKALNPVIVVYSDDGVPEAVYPSDAPIYIDEEPRGGVEASLEDKHVTVMISYDYYVKLVEATREGESFRVRSEEELRVLYELAKKLAVALGQSGAIAAYSAYKALMKLASEGVIEVPESMLEKLPFEPEDVRRMVREQVELETDTAPHR
jgi:hypothetical protein